MSVFLHQGNFKKIFTSCPITCVLIFVNTFMFIITISTGGFSNANLLRLGGISPALVKSGEYYRLLTAIFLHGSDLHFLFNTFFGILIICAGLEKVIGSFKFILVYLITGLISSLSVVFFSGNTLTLGASGAIFGVLGTFLYITVFKPNRISSTDRVYVRNLFFINLIFTFIDPNISISGHLGGLLAGFLLSPIILFDKHYN